MSENTTAVNANAAQWMKPAWVNGMETASKKESNFLTFAPNDLKVIDILSEPVEGVSRYPWPDGTPKKEFKISVREQNATKVLTWAITSRDIMQQLIAIMAINQLPAIMGCRVQVACRPDPTPTTNGLPNKKKEWNIQLLARPDGKPIIALNMAPPAAPAAQGQQQLDSGQKWLESQRQGMTAQPGAV